MPLFGNIVVIKRNGTDGITFPLTASSCLFGRRTECDIRIQLPQVSKEHCKIEVNENKEAILTNLSSVNPTKLNGGCFQQPVPLKHGDVLTIIDRSFRFEYPLQSTPRKRRSRSPKDETLQVLHVQQVTEVELLHKQTSGSASDNAECEEKNGTENKQNTEENISEALPVKLQTPKSSHRSLQSSKRKYEMSPFSQLYENLKQEIKVKKPSHQGNVSQAATKEIGNSVLEPSAVTPGSICDLGSLTEEKERSQTENIEECKITMRQDVRITELNQLLAVGSATKRRFTRTPRTSVSKEMSRDIGQGSQELSTAGESKGPEVTATPLKQIVGNAGFPLTLCPIVVMDYLDQRKTGCSEAAAGEAARATETRNASKGDKCVVSTPTPRRKSPQSSFVSPKRTPHGMAPGSTETPKTGRRVSCKRSFSQLLAESLEDAACRNDGLEQLPLAGTKALKQRRSSKQPTPGTPVKGDVLKEICDQENFVSSEEGQALTPASRSKSPRRNSRQSKELSNKSVLSETLASEELTFPASQTSGSGKKRGRARSSGLLTEKALGTDVIPEQDDTGLESKDTGTKEEVATKESQNQELEGSSATRPHRSPSKRRSGSSTELKDKGAGSEMNIAGLLAGEESGKKKRICQKRKSADVLLQPLGKRKRVSFGGQLSPELFDKSLPPNSPLKRGAIPARLSLSIGNSPRAVLKKALGLKHFAVQELGEHLQKEKTSPKNEPAQKSPAAPSPVSGKATPTFDLFSPEPSVRGRFSVSHITTPPPIAEEKDAGAEDMNTGNKNGAQVRTPEASRVNQDDKTHSVATPEKLSRSAQLALKVTPKKRRSGAVAAIHAKRRNGASSANLLVAKSWAEVVKSGVARPQSKAAKRKVQKGRSLKKRTQAPKTPERKIKGHFSTGHAESPDTIIVGRAYSTTIRTAGRVPKVVKNPILNLNMNMDESFTGMTEMFQTPENKSGNTSPVQKTDFTPTCTAVEISELQTPEECGEMMVSPLNSSADSEQKQDSPGINHLLREEESLEPVLDATATKTPVRRKTMLEENSSVDCSSTIPEKQAASQVKSGSKRRTPRQKLEPVEVLSGIKQLLRTPRQKPEPVEVLSGIKQLMETPKQKLEPVEVLSGIKQLMKTPKQKLEPVEVLSGIKQLMKTPKQKLEPVEVLSGIKQLMKTPKQKLEPVEVLSGIKQLMKTPKQKLEPVEVLSGIKQLLRTPRKKPEPVEDMKQLLRTPQQELEAVTDETAFKRLLKTPVQKKAAPKVKHPPAEDLVGLSRIFKSPKEKAEGREDLCGISRLLSTPREKNQPLDDFVGLQRLMAEPRQKPAGFEVDYAGVTEMFDTPQEAKVRSGPLVDSKQEDTAAPSTNVSKEAGKNILEDKNISQGEDSSQKEATSEEQSTQRPTRSRARKATHPPSEKECEKDLNSKELQDLEKKSTQEEEEVGETRTSPLAAKNKGRGRRRNCCIQEEIVSEHPDQENVEAVSVCGATQRSGRGKRKEPKELKHPSENLEPCGQDSSVLQEEPAAVEQTLQECGISDMLGTEDDPTTKSVSAPGSTAAENCQLQTGVKNPEKKPHEGGLEDSEAMLLSPGERPKGGKKVAKTEPLIAARRGRRGRNDQVKEASSEELHGPTRKLRKDTLAKMEQREEQTCDKDAEAAAAEAAENGPKLGIKVAEKRVQSLRSSRKHSTEVKADICEVALENTQNIEKTEETSPETVTETQACIKNEMKVSQGDETENAQENATEASPKFKAESLSGVTNKTLESALNLETNRGAVQETNRTRKRRGRKDSLEKKTEGLAGDVNNPELISPQIKSDTERDESSFKDSLGSACTKNLNQARQEENSPGASSDSLAQNHQKRTRNKQGTVKPQPTEILQENQAQTNGAARRRGRGKKVDFELEESSCKATGKGALPGDGKGMTDRDGQCEAVENPSSQVRRSRRKQTDSVAQIACSTLMEKQTLSEDQSKDGAFVKEQDSALEAAPSSTGDRTLRRGKRREVAAASQTSRALSTRKGRGLPEGDDKTVAVREDQNSAMGNKSLQAKANASARDKRKKIDLAAEAKSSSSLQRKSGLTEAEDKEENTKEEQNVPLETVSCAKEKPLGRGRRKETALASQATNYISLRGKRGLATNNGREEAPKGDQNVPLGTFDSSVKENQLRKGRRKETTLLSDATSSTWRNRGLSKESGRKNNGGEAKNLILHHSTSQEKMDLPKRNLRQTITSLAAGSTSLQDLPEGGKNETPEEQQTTLLEAAPSARENPSRVGRRKTVSSRSEETSSTALRGKPALPKNRAQKRILKEGEDTPQENDSPQLKTRQLRNKRKKVEFTLEAAPSTSVSKTSNLPENSSTSETPNESLTSTGLEKKHQAGKGKEVTPLQQETSTSRRRKAQLPADALASKKLRSESEDNRSLPKGKRSKTKAEPKEEDVRATRSAGGTDRKTRSSSRTSARTRK
ncbi:proliferation marker protein Ki-67 [Heliangelus exortis]